MVTPDRYSARGDLMNQILNAQVYEPIHWNGFFASCDNLQPMRPIHNLKIYLFKYNDYQTYTRKVTSKNYYHMDKHQFVDVGTC